MQLGWRHTTFILCSYGFWKELRPGVPFLTPFLEAPPKSFNVSQLYGEIYPYWTYSYLIMLVPIFILTDLLRYKPIIILESVSLILTWCVLIWGQTIGQMQIMEVLFGCATAAEVAYYSYIYAKVPHTHYNQVTSYTRTATLIGRCGAYSVSQLLVSLWITDYLVLNYISLGCLCITAVFAVILPSAPGVSETLAADCSGSHHHDIQVGAVAGNASVAQADVSLAETEIVDNQSPLLPPRQPKNSSKEKTSVDAEIVGNTISSSSSSVSAYLRAQLRLAKDSYASTFILKWSIWWALATCGFLQVGNYIQNLWAPMQSDQSTVYNGLTEALNTLICWAGAFVSFSIQFLPIDWATAGELVLGLTTTIQAGLLIWLATTDALWLAYGLYIVFNMFYQMMITVATFNVAHGLSTRSFGLVIGCNTFVALGLQTVLTVAVTDSRGLNLDINTQFIVYGCYFAVIGCIYWLMGFWVLHKNGCKKLTAVETPAEDLAVQNQES